MVVRGLGIVLFIDQLDKRIFLSGIRKQSDQHPVHAKGRRDSASIVLRIRQRVAVPGQGHTLLIVDEAGDPVFGFRKRRLRKIAAAVRRGLGRWPRTPEKAKLRKILGARTKIHDDRLA